MRRAQRGGGPVDPSPARAPITVTSLVLVETVEQHDGSKLVLQKRPPTTTRTTGSGAMSFLVVGTPPRQATGLLYVDREPEDLHGHFNTVEAPLNSLSDKELCPGAAALARDQRQPVHRSVGLKLLIAGLTG